MTTILRFGLTAVLGATLVAAAVGQQASPFTKAGDLLVADNLNHKVWRLRDLDLDGNFNGAGEASTFFASGTSGITLSNTTFLTVAGDGTAWLSDSTTKNIVHFADLDQNGDAMGPGEATVFFGLGNASGISLQAVNGVVVATDGTVFVSNANTGAGGTDMILKLRDLNSDGDAMDAGEAVVYAQFAIGAPGGDSIPNTMALGPDGSLYYVEGASSGLTQKGVYRLHDDVVANGVCTDPGEVSAFWIPTPGPSSPFYQGVVVSHDGSFFLTDYIRGRVLRGKDLNNDHVITAGSTEEALYYNVGAAAIIWNTALGDNGDVYVVEDQAPDRIYRLRDLNNDGNCLAAGEKIDVYQDTLAAVDIGNPRALAFMKGPGLAFTPNPVTIGTTLTMTIDGPPGTAMDVFVSFLPDSVAVPPFGVVGISLAPGAWFELLPYTVVVSAGGDAFALGVPFDPILQGLSVYVQAIGGYAQNPALSNVATVYFQ